MALRLARALQDPEALWQELQAHWQRGHLVGLAPPEERAALAAAVLGLDAAGRTRPRRNSPCQAPSQEPAPLTETSADRPGGARAAAKASAADHRQERGSAPSWDDGSQWPEGDAMVWNPPAARSADGSQDGPARRPEGRAAGGADPLSSMEDITAPALVLGSGGSSGGRRWCLQPLDHLQASARACGAWLEELGLDPGRCLHLDALPLHHVSGLMPLIRARQWQAELRWLPAALLRRPEQLLQACPLPTGRPVLLSLVPTQLHRLLSSPEAIDWLKHCAVIWVGGAALADDLAARARNAGLPLAPCYGATETAAMVCALPPQRFLAGERGCGPPLADAELRLEGMEQAIAVRTARLSPGWFEAGRLRLFRAADGWWHSGDAGAWRPAEVGLAGATRPDGEGTPPALQGIDPAGSVRPTLAPPASLVILGRLDDAIHSGGETVFPDQVRQRLLGLIRRDGLPVAELLLLAEADAIWGERLVALVRWQSRDRSETSGLEKAGEISGQPSQWLSRLAELARALPPSQRPWRWLPCPDLETSITGKWERQRWRNWLRDADAGRAGQPQPRRQAPRAGKRP